MEKLESSYIAVAKKLQKSNTRETKQRIRVEELSHKEGSTDACYTVDKSRKHYAEVKEAGHKRSHIL